MEIFIYYAILAISFAVMYTYSYGIHIVATVRLTVETLGYDMRDYDWSPIGYYIALALFSLVAAPLFIFIMLTEDKWDTVKAAAYIILDRNFDLEKEK